METGILESLMVTIPPVSFLSVLFGGGELFRRKKVDQDGRAPINRTLFYLSKYSILVLWGATVVQGWGFSIAPVEVPGFLRGIALILWLTGFSLLFLGRFGLGSSFRLGTPREGTSLRVDGVYRLSRNPMYLGVYATALASILYTLNPVVVMLAALVIAVHHKIVLAEEVHMQKTFGEEYITYSHRVRRYL